MGLKFGFRNCSCVISGAELRSLLVTFANSFCTTVRAPYLSSDRCALGVRCPLGQERRLFTGVFAQQWLELDDIPLIEPDIGWFYPERHRFVCLCNDDAWQPLPMIRMSRVVVPALWYFISIRASWTNWDNDRQWVWTLSAPFSAVFITAFLERDRNNNDYYDDLSCTIFIFITLWVRRKLSALNQPWVWDW